MLKEIIHLRNQELVIDNTLKDLHKVCDQTEVKIRVYMDVLQGIRNRIDTLDKYEEESNNQGAINEQ